MNRLCLIAALLVAGCSPAPPARPPLVTGANESIRFATGPCFGRCPVFTIEVWSDGRASFSGERFTAVEGRRDFTVTPAQYADYARRLAPYRPRGERRLSGAVCGENYEPDMPWIDVQWIGKDPPDRLHIDIGCDPQANEAMIEAVGRAPEVLGITAWVRGD